MLILAHQYAHMTYRLCCSAMEKADPVSLGHESLYSNIFFNGPLCQSKLQAFGEKSTDSSSFTLREEVCILK